MNKRFRYGSSHKLNEKPNGRHLVSLNACQFQFSFAGKKPAGIALPATVPCEKNKTKR